jgi:hypothetical protein
MNTAKIISLDERRARYQPIEDGPYRAPMLRLVGADEPTAQVFTLEVFLTRARVVMAQPEQSEGSGRGQWGLASS